MTPTNSSVNMLEFACLPSFWCLKLGWHGEHCVSGLCKLGKMWEWPRWHRERKLALIPFFCCNASSLNGRYLKLIIASQRAHNIYSHVVTCVLIYERQNKVFVSIFPFFKSMFYYSMKKSLFHDLQLFAFPAAAVSY